MSDVAALGKIPDFVANGARIKVAAVMMMAVLSLFATTQPAMARAPLIDPMVVCPR